MVSIGNLKKPRHFKVQRSNFRADAKCRSNHVSVEVGNLQPYLGKGGISGKSHLIPTGVSVVIQRLTTVKWEFPPEKGGGRGVLPNLEGAFLGAKTFAAGTARRRVRIFYFEAAIGEGVDVVEFGTGDVESAFGIDDDADAGALDKDVAVGGTILEIHFILEAAATAANDRDAQNALRSILPLQKRADLARGV
jgi:hypothetical protein